LELISSSAEFHIRKVDVAVEKINMRAVGFEPTSANTVVLKTTPLDLSGILAVINHNYGALPLS
jgi:hypothetical protein